ncbi:MAG: MFS transporter [Chloroflexi bacterium]|nr:MFS transporter [Chloroflexota bacterium]
MSSGYEVPILIIVLAFALRSLVWSSVDLAPEETVWQAILIGISAGLGKLVGGFLSDKMGWLNWMIVALIGSALSLTLARGQTLVLTGVFLLQSGTGLTIAWLGRVLPESPAFAASLALGAAVIIGGLPFVFTDGTWFGETFLLSALSLSMLGYLVALRGNMEKRQTNN